MAVIAVILLITIGFGIKTADDRGGKIDKKEDITKIEESLGKTQESEEGILNNASIESAQKDTTKENNVSDKKKDDNIKESQSEPQNSGEVIYKPPVETGSDKKGENIAPSKTEKKYPKISGGKITCDSFGRYSGQYVEDGRDELVESVATVLITNRSDEYLEYATLTFDVEGQAANFIVTGLPAGASAWVMEASKLAVESGTNFAYQDCVSDFRDDVTIASDKVSLSADGNLLTATNKSNEEMKSVVVYYRKLHKDGNYLGGVTYTAEIGDLKSGDSTQVIAGHYTAKDCEVVRVSWENQ